MSKKIKGLGSHRLYDECTITTGEYLKLRFHNNVENWKDHHYVRTIFDIFSHNGILEHYFYFTEEIDSLYTYCRVESVDDIMENFEYVESDRPIITIAQHNRDAWNNHVFQLGIGEDSVDILVQFPESLLTHDFLDRFKKCIVELNEAFKDVAFFRSSTLGVSGIDFDNVESGDVTWLVHKTSLMNLISKKNFYGTLEQKEILENSDLPDFAIREKISEDLFLITWCKDLFDGETLIKNLIEKDRWIAEHL